MDGDDRPWVPVPERLDRRLRLGPFASGQDALKFLSAAAVAAVVSVAVAPWAGLPIVAIGALVALWRPDDEPLDERGLALARWALRRPRGPGPMTAAAPGAVLPLPDGRLLAVLRTGGVPLAYLPPAEIARQFERYRELWRAVEGGIVLHATGVPICAEALLPATTVPAAEAAACAGYGELVRLLARRRLVRRVIVALASSGEGADRAVQLETSVGLLSGRLSDLGLRAERLSGPGLTAAARSLGLAEGEGR